MLGVILDKPSKAAYSCFNSVVLIRMIHIAASEYAFIEVK